MAWSGLAGHPQPAMLASKVALRAMRPCQRLGHGRRLKAPVRPFGFWKIVFGRHAVIKAMRLCSALAWLYPLARRGYRQP